MTISSPFSAQYASLRPSVLRRFVATPPFAPKQEVKVFLFKQFYYQWNTPTTAIHICQPEPEESVFELGDQLQC